MGPISFLAILVHESGIRSILLGSISGNKLTFDGTGSSLDSGLPSRAKLRPMSATNKTTWTVLAGNKAYVAPSSETKHKTYQAQHLTTNTQPSAKDKTITSVTVDRAVNGVSNVSVSFNKLVWVLSQRKNGSQSTTQPLSRQKRQSNARVIGQQPQQRIVLLMSPTASTKTAGRSINRLVKNSNGEILLVVRQPGGVKVDHRHLQNLPVTTHIRRGVNINHGHLQKLPANTQSGRRAVGRNSNPTKTKEQGGISLTKSTMKMTPPTQSTLRRATPTNPTLIRVSPTKATTKGSSPTKTTLKRANPTRATLTRKDTTNPTRRTLTRISPTQMAMRRTTLAARQKSRHGGQRNNRRPTGARQQISARRSSSRTRSTSAIPTRSRSLVRTMSSNDLLRRRQQRRRGNNVSGQMRTRATRQRSTSSGQRQVRQRQSRPDPFTQRFSAGFARGTSLLEQPPMDFTGFDGTSRQQGGVGGGGDGVRSETIRNPRVFRQFPGFQTPMFPDFSAPGFGGGLPRGPGMF